MLNAYNQNIYKILIATLLFTCTKTFCDADAQSASPQAQQETTTKTEIQGLLPKTYNPFQRQAVLDLVEIEKILKEHHPGAHDIDEEADAFKAWLIQGKKDFLQRLPGITSGDSALFSLKAYITGFQDAHMSLYGGTKHFLDTQWPLFLTEFNGKRFIAPQSTTKDIPNGSTITKIDDLPIQEWVDNYILPFATVGPKSTAAHYNVAPIVFSWRQNPFIPKPKTVCIEQKYGQTQKETKVKLQWKQLSWKDLAKKCAMLRKDPSLKQRLDPLTITDIGETKDIAWVKIPTFEPATSFGMKMFKRSIKKLSLKRNKRALIFDLRGNTGGRIHLAGETLQYLFGGKETTDTLKDCMSSFGRTPTSLHANRWAAGGFTTTSDELTSALVTNSSAIIEDSSYSFELKPGEKLTAPSPKEPPTCKIYAIIDSSTFSTSLIFIDLLKKLTNNNVFFIGQPTWADTKYIDIQNFRIHGMTLSLPISIYRGRSRASNEQYMPDVKLSGTRMKDDAWLQKKVLNIINGRR